MVETEGGQEKLAYEKFLTSSCSMHPKIDDVEGLDICSPTVQSCSTIQIKSLVFNQWTNHKTVCHDIDTRFAPCCSCKSLWWFLSRYLGNFFQFATLSTRITVDTVQLVSCWLTLFLRISAYLPLFYWWGVPWNSFVTLDLVTWRCYYFSVRLWSCVFCLSWR